MTALYVNQEDITYVQHVIILVSIVVLNVAVMVWQHVLIVGAQEMEITKLHLDIIPRRVLLVLVQAKLRAEIVTIITRWIAQIVREVEPSTKFVILA